MREWTFLTSHGRALLVLADDPNIILRDLAAAIGVTERTAHAIVNDLCASGHLAKERVGRSNRYTIVTEMHLPDVATTLVLLMSVIS
jgi:DNA-binding MarR family transcriptional regulator